MLRHLTNEAVLNEGHKRETQRSATERRERLTAMKGKEVVHGKLEVEDDYEVAWVASATIA